MIRVAVLDEHPAVRRGIESIVRGEPGLATAGLAADRHELWPLLYRADPDVLVVGRPRGDEPLVLCLRIRARSPRTRLVFYADGDDVAVPAHFAGIDAVVDRAAEPRELLAALRGERALPELRVAAQRSAAERLDARDRAIFAMRLAGTAPHEIAGTLGLTLPGLSRHLGRIVALLRGAAAAPLPAA
jgi:DNA-binding NarL/FixJ family response regulator